MNFLKNTRDYYFIRKSKLFDVVWFKNKYNLKEHENPIKYYLVNGISEGLNPSKDFDTLWYLNEYEDVKKSGMNPFVHYILHGIYEHRLTKPLLTKNNDKFSLTNFDYDPCFFKEDYTSINTNDVNIAIFIKNELNNLLPTEYIRIVIPFYHLFLKRNFNPFLLHNDDIKKLDLSNFDIVLVQRDALDKNSAVYLVKTCKTQNIKLIYEIDDDLINIDKNHPNYAEFIGKVDAIKYLVSNADIVVVSSHTLKEKLLKYNSNIQILKNSLNDMLNLENNVENNFNSVKIGYMGTKTHKNDVKIVEKAIENVIKYFKKKGKNVVFETIGISEDKIGCANDINVPFKYSKYPYFIRWLKRIIDWDIAIAPLEKSNINHSKSEIKYLEYSSLGIPGIYSNFGAYAESIKNNKNGILVENNTIAEWQSALINLVESEQLRKDIVKNSKKDIKSNYSIDLTVNLWINIFEKLLTKNKREVFNKHSLKLLTNPLFNEDYDIIEKSNLFDEKNYPIICHNSIYHFLKIGVFQNLNPSKEFCTEKYVKKHNINCYEINPFVHFIQNFIEKFRYNNLNSENIGDIKINLKKKVSIIVPIYNAYDDTKMCIESVLKYSAKNYELILINDSSTDKRIHDLLNSYKDNPKIKIINNNSNLGFVSSINIGLKNSKNDVIILNSDTIVTPKWSEKLTVAAYSDKKIATVTPFSNNAGVFSVPKMNHDNLIPSGLSLNDVANIVEKVSKHEYMRVPTGNGFCMYIKRDVINSVGYFDEISFQRGYGEENDFCMRVKDKGWENIIDDSTYIFHNENSSFGDEKKDLLKKHARLIVKKYLNYQHEVRNFINSKKLHKMQQNISNAINHNQLKERVLYIGDIGEKFMNNDMETYLLCVEENLILYYVCDDFRVKIMEWSVYSINDVCFDICVNFEIDVVINNNYIVSNPILNYDLLKFDIHFFNS